METKAIGPLAETLVRRLESRQHNTRTSSLTTTEDLSRWAEWFEIQTFGDRQLELMVKTVGEFVLDMRADPMNELAFLDRHWLTITGSNGVGKTMVARRVWRWFQEHGRFLEDWVMLRQNYFCKCRNGRFVDWRRMVTRLRDGSAFAEFNELRDVWLLILDEIGMEQDKSGFATDKLAELLSARLHKWTLITSNVSVQEWAAIDARIGSRMMRDGSKVIEVKCRDYATRKLQQEITHGR